MSAEISWVVELGVLPGHLESLRLKAILDGFGAEYVVRLAGFARD